MTKEIKSVKTEELEDHDVAVIDDVTNASKVILFNDEWHSFDEVIGQILKATNCSFEKAEALTWEVHTKGKAVVFEGEFVECLKVSGILEEIGLHTQIEC
jgi:ATP-dependent Clp protease adapter protein ClpS